jgi:translation initiation factor IF-2
VCGSDVVVAQQAVGVSAVTGAGADELFEAVDAAADEYWKYGGHHQSITTTLASGVERPTDDIAFSFLLSFSPLWPTTTTGTTGPSC